MMSSLIVLLAFVTIQFYEYLQYQKLDSGECLGMRLMYKYLIQIHG